MSSGIFLNEYLIKGGQDLSTLSVNKALMKEQWIQNGLSPRAFA